MKTKFRCSCCDKLKKEKGIFRKWVYGESAHDSSKKDKPMQKLNNLEDNFDVSDEPFLTYQEFADRLIYFGQFSRFKELLSELDHDSLLTLLVNISPSASNYKEAVRDYLLNNFSRASKQS